MRLRGSRRALQAGLLLLLVGAPRAAIAEGGPNPSPIVVICSPHHRVLRYWLEQAEAGGLPRSGVRVVHFDAHPDLALPSVPVAPDWPADPGALVRSLDIASFQLAAVRIGLVDRIVWLRPPWAAQFSDGERRFRLGQLSTGELRVDDPSDYYVLDGSWAPGFALHGAREVSLRVLPLGSSSSLTGAARMPTILDIDLDGFATHNPAARRLRRLGWSGEDLATVREIFLPSNLDLEEDPVRRQEQVERVTVALTALGERGWRAIPEVVGALWGLGVGPLGMASLIPVVTRDPDRLSLSDLAEAGRDLVGLPEHAPDPDEIEKTALALARLAGPEGLHPELITIARSVADGFTPGESLSRIESALLRALRDQLGPLRIHYDRGVLPVPGSVPGSETSPRLPR